MEMQYFKEYSQALGREMECKVYGHGGRPQLDLILSLRILHRTAAESW